MVIKCQICAGKDAIDILRNILVKTTWLVTSELRIEECVKNMIAKVLDRLHNKAIAFSGCPHGTYQIIDVPGSKEPIKTVMTDIMLLLERDYEIYVVSLNKDNSIDLSKPQERLFTQSSIVSPFTK